MQDDTIRDEGAEPVPEEAEEERPGVPEQAEQYEEIPDRNRI